MDTQPNNGKLFARITLVMAAVRGMVKDGTNTQSNFKYVSSDGALDRIGKAMADNGLVIIPMLTEYESIDEQTGNGKTRTRTRAQFQMHICDTDGNAFVTRWAGEGTDYGNPDRALNKAMTNATKYFLLKLFVVGAGDEDPDGAGAEDERTARGRTLKGTQPAQQPQAQQQVPAPPTQAGRGEIVTQWARPEDAWQWAVDKGASENIHAARSAFARLIQERFNGKLSAQNIGAAYREWYDDRMAKLSRGEVDPPAEDADTVQQKFDGATPEARGAKPSAGQRMSARMQPA